MRRSFVIFLTISLCAAACSKKEEPTPAEPNAEETPAAPESTAGESPKRTMKEVVDAITQAVKDSKEAETGDTVCERAYSAQISLSNNLMKTLGQDQAPIDVDREKFLEVCNGLPPEAQECLRPSHALDNREECRRIKQELGPDVAAKLRAAVRKPADTEAEEAAP
ncbi:MAG: hypothetical protein GXY23_00910 [Myxococcales bacterium]|nr:hypothetical protein [Myxococcales bacterium]